MKMKLIAGAAALLLPATSAQATTYADRASFLAALSGTPITIDFAGLVGTPDYPTYTTGGYASLTGYTLQGVTFKGIAPYYWSYIFDPINPYRLGNSSSGMFDQFGGLFLLNTPTNGFALDWGSSSGTGNPTIVLNFDDSTNVSMILNFSGEVNFFGYVGTKLITSINIDDPSNSVRYFKYDNVTLGKSATSAVPESASWAMMIAGFGIIGALSRRRTPTGIISLV